MGCPALHSGGNDRFCARLKTDISAFSSGHQGHLRSCLTILDSSWRLLSKNVRHDLVRPQRSELEAEMSVFNLAQKRSFPPLWAGLEFFAKLFFKKSRKKYHFIRKWVSKSSNFPTDHFFPDQSTLARLLITFASLRLYVLSLIFSLKTGFSGATNCYLLFK
jgi:hypothetical protein